MIVTHANNLFFASLLSQVVLSRPCVILVTYSEVMPDSGEVFIPTHLRVAPRAIASHAAQHNAPAQYKHNHNRIAFPHSLAEGA